MVVVTVRVAVNVGVPDDGATVTLSPVALGALFDRVIGNANVPTLVAVIVNVADWPW